MELFTEPVFWLAIGILMMGILVVSVLISKKRRREVEELESFFPGEEEYDTSGQISIETVQQKRKQRLQETQKLFTTSNYQNKRMTSNKGIKSRKDGEGLSALKNEEDNKEGNVSQSEKQLDPSNNSTANEVEESPYEATILPAESRRNFKKKLLTNKHKTYQNEAEKKVEPFKKSSRTHRTFTVDQTKDNENFLNQSKADEEPIEIEARPMRALRLNDDLKRSSGQSSENKDYSASAKFRRRRIE